MDLQLKYDSYINYKSNIKMTNSSKNVFVVQSTVRLLFKIVSHRVATVGTVGGSQLQDDGYISYCSLTEL